MADGNAACGRPRSKEEVERPAYGAPRDVTASGLRRRADRNHVKSNTMVERLGQQAAVRFRLGGAEHVLLA